MSAALDVLKADFVADARNNPCPGPLLTAKQSIGLIEVGQVLELLVTDKGAAEDIPAYAKKSGNEFLGTVPRAGYDSYFILRKK